VYSGRKLALLESDLEHGIPASVGAKMSEQGANYYLTKWFGVDGDRLFIEAYK
jgi:hypothetical protein